MDTLKFEIKFYLFHHFFPLMRLDYYCSDKTKQHCRSCQENCYSKIKIDFRFSDRFHRQSRSIFPHRFHARSVC